MQEQMSHQRAALPITAILKSRRWIKNMQTVCPFSSFKPGKRVKEASPLSYGVDYHSVTNRLHVTTV